jgi:hypothetical protein
MPDEVITPAAAEVKAPLTASERFEAFKAAKAAAATPEGIAAKAAADKLAADTAAGVAPVVEKRLSGDERKFKNLRRQFRTEMDALKGQLAAATAAKPAAAAAVDPTAAPKREAFAAGTAGDAEFDEARIAHAAQKAIDKSKAEDAQTKTRNETIAAYNAQIAAGPDKYDDWDATVEAGKGGALTVDLGKECPALMWAIAKSDVAADLYYAWLKDASKLQKLIDMYKAGPEGVTDALVAFHRFEGQVGKAAPSKDDAAAKAAATAAAAAKASKDAAAPKPKPKPSAEASVKGGAAAPDGKPALYVPGTHTINPAYKAFIRAQRAA